MIEVEHLTKYYGAVPAIQDVSLSVNKGEIVGFLGPNSAGKTTTMRILSGYMPPTAGTARVAGYDVMRDSLEVRRRIGYLPETVPLYPEMAVRSYLEYMGALRGVAKPAQAAERAMESCGLADRREMLIGKLSKGYRQRVGLAQAIIHDPEVLILDEPTIGLDPRQIIEVRNLIKGLAGSHTVILSTHILPEVSQVCQRVMIINKGRIVAEDTPERLTGRLRGAQQLHIQVARPAGDARTALEAVPGVLTVAETSPGCFEVESALDNDPRTKIAELIVGRGWGLLELRPVGMSLEEIFLTLTTEDAARAAEEDGPTISIDAAPGEGRRDR
ncbi:MAG TPA: ATP-binding cassette domain-containing protein [Anaerolineae bacterium]|nr:ATP-binding cassette domain-containing protein [Anaerolineae bacterium]HPL29830.1 ATP-binding cassette domain-containing protein [Anaerolineae bacterium]